MSDYLNKPRTYDSPEVIEAARSEIDRRAWTRQDGHDLATHLQAARKDLSAYLADLDQRNLVSGTILGYLQAVLESQLEKVQEATEADGPKPKRHPAAIAPSDVIVALYLAFDRLLYESSGALWLGLQGDSAVTDEVAPALSQVAAWLRDSGDPRLAELMARGELDASLYAFMTRLHSPQ